MVLSRRLRRTYIPTLDIPGKANRILNLILIVLILFTIRIWHLSIVQYDDKIEEARKPRNRVILEASRRATIRDRFNIPLATNKIQYQAAVFYSQLREIPYSVWKKDVNGKRVKHFKRKEYIAQLSEVLGKELGMDSQRIEDLIHAKASFYYHIPFVIKEDITEQEYYRLKMLEKDWLGIHTQRMPKRHYPYGRVGSDIIGYLGAINRTEYQSIIQEIKTLEQTIADREEGGESPLPEGMTSLIEVKNRLRDLEDKAYTINDYVGKTGIEGMFEEQLRGFHGKKSYYSDARGNFVRELPGSRRPLSGQRFLLTISAELQEYAEELLIQNEDVREAYISNADHSKQITSKQPWIKGGAIIAMDPNTGEVLALASHPRFDPNDFIASGNPEVNKEKNSNILRWFESEAYLGDVWDQKRPFEREKYDSQDRYIYEEKTFLTWDKFLQFVLPLESVVKANLERIGTIANATEMLNSFNSLLDISEQESPQHLLNTLYNTGDHILFRSSPSFVERDAIEKNLKAHQKEVAEHKRKLDRYFLNSPYHYDKLLTIDLCRLLIVENLFSNELLKEVGRKTLSGYRDASAALINIAGITQAMAKELYHELYFKSWRKEYEKEFLKQKREEEKSAKQYAKPYIDYLDGKENELFAHFWAKNRAHLILAFILGYSPIEDLPPEEHNILQPYISHFLTWHEELQQGAHKEMPWKPAYTILQQELNGISPASSLAFIETMRSYRELLRPLLGRYQHLRNNNGEQLEMHLAASFYPRYGFGYGRSYAYRQSATQGSIFKLVTAYASLAQRYQKKLAEGSSLRDLNPLEIIDKVTKEGNQWHVGSFMSGTAIPQIYKGGRLPRSSNKNIGQVDLLKAIEVSSNPYFSLLAGDTLNNATDLADAARLFSFGSRTGIDLPAEIAGKVPDDLDHNRTGLYAMAIGQHSLVVTPLQTAVMLTALANGGKVVKPKIVLLTAGREPLRPTEGLPNAPLFPYQNSLALVGIHFPLFTAVAPQEHQNLIHPYPLKVMHEIFMPNSIRNMLLDGMRRVVTKSHNENLSSLTRLYKSYPEAIYDFHAIKDEWIGKTSTAEALETLDLDLVGGTNMYTHVWFGGISFQPDEKNKNTFVFRDQYGHPELVVVVYLRYGRFGKETAPVAAQMVNKWREIKETRKLGARSQKSGDRI